MFWILFIVLLLTLLAYILYRRILIDEDFEKIPGPKGIFLFGNAFDFLLNSGSIVFHYIL